nr:putative helicase c15c4.05 [Quercus suber]
MAGGKKKKTKPTANIARGFATTSIQSVNKLKSEDTTGTTCTETSDASTPQPATGTEAPVAASTSSVSTAESKVREHAVQRQLYELSPEELEVQLDISELQQLVEQNAPKVRKESVRQISRLQTDRRVLRGQAEFLSVKDWLSDELMQQVFELTLDEHAAEQLTARRKRPDVPELLSKVWTLRSCLLDLDLNLSPSRIEEVLGHVVSHPPASEISGVAWGLPISFDWLSLHCNPEELIEYDAQKPKLSTIQNGDYDDDSPIRSDVKNQGKELEKLDSPGSSDIDNVLPSSHDVDVDVSDLGSDLEPDELVATHLRTRRKLFEINPSSQDQGKRKKGHKAHDSTPISTAERKLQQKLSKIESDALFDQHEADSQWAVQKINLAREAADRKRLQLADHQNSRAETRVSSDKTEDVNNLAEQMGQQLLDDTEQDDDLLGGIFTALPGIGHLANEELTTPDSASMTIRDFGKLTGMSPKRILEETCKARDARVRLNYKLISPTTYASRHSLQINWSKDQDILDGLWITRLAGVKSQHRSIIVTAMHEATPEIAQSEAYIATLALFLVFHGSPKEEKAHMRLPPAFRDLWIELTSLKQDSADSADRDIVKGLRGLINRHSALTDDDDDEEVVFDATSRRRFDVTSRSSTPQSTTEVPQGDRTEVSQELINLWAYKSGTANYQRMLSNRMALPMFQFRAAALETIDRHQVTILCGETGCGKSTQLPAFILEHELSQGRHCKVYCTEPRRISAISLAQRVSEEMGEHKGDVGTSRSLVGYAIRLESHTTALTRLCYATVGIVLRMLERPDGLSDVTHLVIDEVHERSIDTDFLLIMLRSLMARRPKLKVILMSATVDAQKFSDYLDGAPIINVPGRTYPVRAMFLEDAIELTGHTNEDASSGVVEETDEFAESDITSDPSSTPQLSDYSKATRNTLAGYDIYRIDYSLIVKLLQKVAIDINFSKFSQAILIFLPGIAEIRQLNEMLTGHPFFRQSWNIHALHSSFSSEDQQAAFDVPPKGIRKIVLATNIAETGITIPDVTCVIDLGKHKEMRFDERRQLSKLILSFIAKANAKQRRGRAGRVQEGLCFHLFTKQRHDELMAEQQTPEMLRLSLQDLVMRVKICKLGDIETALSQALDPPSSRNIRRAIDALIEVDALTPNEELTSLGLHIAKLPLDAQLSKLVLISSIWGCLDFALTVAATLTSKSPFLNPIHAKKQADTVRLGYKRGDSDLLTMYNAYCAWRKVCTTQGMSEYQFCNKNFLSSPNLSNIEDLKGQLLNALVDAGFVQLSADERAALMKVRPGARQRNFVMLPAHYCRADDDDNVVQSVVAWSFYPKIVQREGKGFRNVANNQSLGLHPSSVNRTGLPVDVKLLSFYSIMQSSSRFTNAQETTPCPEIALVLLAGDAVLNMYAGVVVIDGNRLRYKVRDWKTMFVLKILRIKLKDVLARLFKQPGRQLQGKHKVWQEILEKILGQQHNSRPQLA